MPEINVLKVLHPVPDILDEAFLFILGPTIPELALDHFECIFDLYIIFDELTALSTK